MSLWAVVPVKSFARAKARLSPVLGADERASLSHTLFQHVIGTLRVCRGIDEILVATDCDEVELLARDAGTYVIRDEPGATLSEIVDAALARCRKRGAIEALVAMADLPFVELRDIEKILQLPTRAALVAAPDGLGEGTNALLLRDLSIPTQFGRPDSFRRHMTLLPRTASYYADGLAFDIDEPADLRAARLVAEAVAPSELVAAAADSTEPFELVDR